MRLVLGRWPAAQGDRRAAAQVPAGRRRAPRARGGAGRPDGMRAITLVKVRERLAASRCWRSPSRPAARTRSACTWRPRGHPIAGDDKYGDFERNKTSCKTGAETHVPARLAAAVHHRPAGERIELHAPLPPNCSFCKHLAARPMSRPRQFDLIALRLGRHPVRLHRHHRAQHPAGRARRLARAQRRRRRLCDRHGRWCRRWPCRARRAGRQIPRAGGALPPPLPGAPARHQPVRGVLPMLGGAARHHWLAWPPARAGAAGRGAGLAPAAACSTVRAPPTRPPASPTRACCTS